MSAARTATTPNQTIGGVPVAERSVNNATPVIDPTMSMLYAFSGGIDVSSRPSGTASPAMIIVAMIRAPAARGS